jgi:hypothetical protein
MMNMMTFDKAGDLRDLLFTIIESMPYGLLLADRQAGWWPATINPVSCWG